MGVKSLWALLDDVKVKYPLENMSGLSLAVDLGCWVVEMDSDASFPNKLYLRNLFFRVQALLQHRIKLLFVSDGKAVDLKIQTIAQRLGYQNIELSEKQMSMLKSRNRFRHRLSECEQLLAAVGIPYLKCEGEAEKVCAYLTSQGVVDGCITTDGDAFLYGATTVFRRAKGEKDIFYRYTAEAIKSVVGFNHEQLIAFGCLVGCDYVPKGIVGIGKELASRFLKENINPLTHFMSFAYSSKDCDGIIPFHCGECGAVSSREIFHNSGCLRCGSSKNGSYGSKCDCRWHKAQLKNLDTKGINIKFSKASQMPFGDVISEFLDHNPLPKISLHWHRPNPSSFKEFMAFHLNWMEQLTLLHFSNLSRLWCMNEILKGIKDHNGYFVPLKINKRRTRHFQPCLELRWQMSSDLYTIFSSLKRDEFDFEPILTSIEKEEWIKKCYPQLYQEYLTSEVLKSKKTSSAKGSTKKSAKKQLSIGQAVLDDFVSKVEELNLNDGGKENAGIIANKQPTSPSPIFSYPKSLKSFDTKLCSTPIQQSALIQSLLPRLELSAVKPPIEPSHYLNVETPKQSSQKMRSSETESPLPLRDRIRCRLKML